MAIRVIEYVVAGVPRDEDKRVLAVGTPVADLGIRISVINFNFSIPTTNAHGDSGGGDGDARNGSHDAGVEAK